LFCIGLQSAALLLDVVVPLKSQPDFINALKAARQFAHSASQELAMQVGANSLWLLSSKRQSLNMMGMTQSITNH
jgi:hypothetical protein